MVEGDIALFQRYRKKLQQKAWNIQYHVRKRNKNELLIFDSDIKYYQFSKDFSSRSISNLFVEELIRKLSSEKGMFIIRQILDGYTEKEISIKLNISQQAVNKWKIKCFNELKEHLHSLEH